MNTTLREEMTVYDLANMMMAKFEKIEEVMATKDDLIKLEARLGQRIDRVLGLAEHRTKVLKDVIEQDLNTKVIW